MTDSTPSKRCSRCGQVKPLGEFNRHSGRKDGLSCWCRPCDNESNREFWAANIQQQRERKRIYYAENRERETERDRRYRDALRRAVFDHYGNACACCGATEDLTIDHVGGDGRQHREELFGTRFSSGVRFWRWLVRNGFPGGYQVLCRRCNLSKGTGQRCRLVHEHGAY